MVQDKHQLKNPNDEKYNDIMEEVQPEIEKLDTMEDIFNVFNSIDGVLEIPQPDSKDHDASPINQDTDTSEVHPSMEVTSSGINFLSSVKIGAHAESAFDQDIVQSWHVFMAPYIDILVLDQHCHQCLTNSTVEP